MSNTKERELSRKETNIKRVVHVALASFVKYGIENSKVSEIGRIAGLTERSVFRYFETKSDLVLSSALLFWKRVKTLVEKNVLPPNESSLTGIEDIEMILNKYSSVCFNYPKQLIFVQEAESYLYRTGKELLIKTKILSSFVDSTDPLALAIKKGIKDGTVRNSPNIEDLYFNAYDSLLGLMEKFAIRTNKNDDEEKKQREERLKSFCHVLVQGFSN